MAEHETDMPEATHHDAAPAKKKRDWGHYWRTRIIGGIVGLLLLLGLGVVLLDSPIGHRFIANSLADYAPASGLRIEVGRIDGSILGDAQLTDVAFSDPKGEFLRVPEMELDWRPLKWFTSGLYVKKLVARRGHLMRMPELNSSDEDAPLLPNFDIRVDRLEITGLQVDEAVAGFERKIDLFASADITDGRAKIDLNSELGGEDRLFAKLDADQNGDVLDLMVDYNAPAGGLLAGMTGAEEDLQINIGGKGSWTEWKGGALVRQGDNELVTMQLTKKEEIYGLLGQVRPRAYVSGTAADALGEVVSLRFDGTFKDSVINGRTVLAGDAVKALANGAVDLDGNRFDGFSVRAILSDPGLLGPDIRAEGLAARLGLDGEFRKDLAIAYRVTTDRFASGTTSMTGLRAEGTGNWNGERLLLPLDATASTIRTGSEMVDPRLRNARLTATVTYSGDKLIAPDIAFDSSGAGARLALDGNVATGDYRITGPVIANGVAFDGLGSANARANIDARLTASGYSLSAKVDGRMTRVTNDTLANYVGSPIPFTADVTLSSDGPVLIRSAEVNAEKLTLAISGEQAVDGTVKLSGKGEQETYGPFTVDATIDGKGPRAELVFADPLPAAGLQDVRVAIAPSEDGFLIDTDGQSMLGEFTGNAELISPADGPTRIAISALTVSDTTLSGDLTVEENGIAGELGLTGGGVSGDILLTPKAEGQGLDTDIILRDAQFTGDPVIGVRLAHIRANGVIGDAATLDVAINAQGISRGDMFIGRFAAEGHLEDGTGTFRANLAGRRGSRFRMRLAGEVSGERIQVAARGRYAGRAISMPRAVVLLRDDNGWTLQKSQINFAGGKLQAEGRFGTQTDATVRVLDMPLDVANLFVEDLGLGGAVSGVVEYHSSPGAAPTGRARLLLNDLTRSGLVLTSRPVDLALVAELSGGDMQLRSVIRDDASRTGRLQARISDMPAAGTLVERLSAGSLFAQLRYKGPAEALWRLAAIETFDLTGEVSVGGDVRGTIVDPQIRGTVTGDDLRLQSTRTGTDVTGITANGTFDGSMFRLQGFSGTSGNGTVRGSGSVDLSNLAEGIGMDIRIAANNARLLDRDDMGATVTGPIRIVAEKGVGTIAARLDMIEGNWKLANTDAVANLPSIKRTEVNIPADRQIAIAASEPWNYLMDVRAKNRFVVTGMGLDSEWGANVRLRGNTDAPIMYGQADLVRGDYTFAGKRFDLTRGRISFTGSNPPDPRLDIEAEADINDITATINITGTAYEPEISFSSVPALPEEEVLSRLLFGDSISNISAPEALQLGAALASLQGGGGGLDPINKIRSAIGLDRLRVVGADEALGRGTSVAVGQYIGRNLYVELVTDGKGYSATELEYRITNWLSLLGTISSINYYNSIEAKASKDY